MKTLLLIVVGVTVAITACANPVVDLTDPDLDREMFRDLLLGENNWRPSILGREDLTITVSEYLCDIDGTFVFAKSQTDKSVGRNITQFRDTYLHIPVYVPVSMSNNSEIVQLTRMKVVVDERKIRTAIAEGPASVDAKLKAQCPKKLRIVWFRATLTEKFLAYGHKRVRITYRQKNYMDKGKRIALYTPVLPLTKETVKSATPAELKKYKSWYKITAKAGKGVSLALKSQHTIKPTVSDSATTIHPVDLEPIVIQINSD